MTSARSRLTTLALASALVAALGSLLVSAGCGDPATAAAPGAPPPAPVTVAHPVVKGIVEWHRYTGRLEPVESVEIRARVSGYIDAVHFTEGELVRRGAPLYRIDPRPFEAELKRAQATLAEATAHIARARALAASAAAQRTRAAAEASLAASRLQNAVRALESDAIARELYDARRSEADQAQAAVLEADADVAAAAADIASAEAAETTARALVEQAQLDLEYTEVLAPITGRIGRRLVTRGNLVQGGAGASTLLTTLVSLDPIHVYMDADEQAYLKYVRQVRAGDRPDQRAAKVPIYLALSDETGYPHKGYVDFVDNRVDAATGTMRARGILRNPDHVLTAGLFATVQVPGSTRHDAVLVPESAIGSDQARRFVYVVDAAGAVTQQAVELGPRAHGLRVIRSGLTGTEQIVVRGLQRIRPGVTVAPTLAEVVVSELDDGLPDDFEPVPPAEWIPVGADEDGVR